MPEIIVSHTAESDLDKQWEYLAGEVGDPELAARFVTSAKLTFFDLARTPTLGRIRTYPAPELKGIRSWKVDGFPKHLIFTAPFQKGRESKSCVSSTEPATSRRFWAARKTGQPFVSCPPGMNPLGSSFHRVPPLFFKCKVRIPTTDQRLNRSAA